MVLTGTFWMSQFDFDTPWHCDIMTNLSATAPQVLLWRMLSVQSWCTTDLWNSRNHNKHISRLSETSYVNFSVCIAFLCLIQVHWKRLPALDPISVYFSFHGYKCLDYIFYSMSNYRLGINWGHEKFIIWLTNRSLILQSRCYWVLYREGPVLEVCVSALERSLRLPASLFSTCSRDWELSRIWRRNRNTGC